MGKIDRSGPFVRHKTRAVIAILAVAITILVGSCFVGTAYAAQLYKTNTNMSLVVSATPTPAPTSALIVKPDMSKNITRVTVTPTPTPKVIIRPNITRNNTMPNLTYVGDGGAEEQLAYATQMDLGQVAVIDMTSNTVISTIKVGAGPAGIAVSPDGTQAFVVNGNEGTVSVIDTASHKVTRTIGVGKGAVMVTFSADGAHAYVTNQQDGTVSDIDVATHTVIGTYATGKTPFGIAVNPVNGDVYVLNQGDSTLSVLRSGSIIATLPVGKDPSFGVVVSPDGKRVYVANMNGNNLSIVDTTVGSSAYAVAGSIPTGMSPWGLALSADGTRLYVTALASQELQTIDLASGSVISSLKLPYPGVVAFGADEKTLYVAKSPYFSENLTVVDVPGNKIKGYINTSANYYDIAAIKPSGTIVAESGSTSAGTTVTDTPQGQDQLAEQPTDTGAGTAPDSQQAGGEVQDQGDASVQQNQSQGPVDAQGNQTVVTAEPNQTAAQDKEPANKVVSVAGFEGIVAVLGLFVAIVLAARRSW